MDDLTAAEVIAAGGWHAEYALVPVIAVAGDVAVAVVAGNGLGYEMEVEVLRRGEDSWQGAVSWGFSPATEGHSTGAIPGCAYAVGVCTGGAGRRVLIGYHGEIAEVFTNELGFWAWIEPIDDPWRWGAPEVVAEE